VKTISVSEAPPRALDVKSLRRLLREVYVHGSKRDIAIIELMAGSAIRVGELVMLSVSDAEISERKGMLHIRNGKGRASRQVPLNVDVRKALNDWIDVRPTTNSNYLFIGQRGERMTTNGIWRIVKKFGQMAGIPNIQVHDLRRTVLTRLLREFKNDYSLVCSISGHKNMKTLMIYTKPTSEDLAVAMDGLTFTGE
jgi:integrase/recombinase XerC/integrase/recombinase XerD